MKYSAIILSSAFLRVSYAVLNGYFGPAPGADLDAVDFTFEAMRIAKSSQPYEWSIGPQPYLNALSVVFQLFGESVFVASMFSVCSWAASIFLFFKTLKIMQCGNQFSLPLILFSLLPFSIIYTSAQLREPFQMLFVNLIAFALAKILVEKRPIYWFWLIIGAIGAGALHGALTAFATAALCSAPIYVVLTGKTQFALLKVFIALGAAYTVLTIGMELLSSTRYNLSSGLLEAATTYQQGFAGDARAHYKGFAPTSGNLTFSDVLIGLFQYFAEPLPWNVATFADFVLFVENMIRIYCVAFCFVSLWRQKTGNKHLTLLYLGLYSIGETIWSLGTVNWGTAGRHHIPMSGFLLVAYFIARNGKVTPGKQSRKYYRPANLFFGDNQK
jgi:hypothetical protein